MDEFGIAEIMASQIIAHKNNNVAQQKAEKAKAAAEAEAAETAAATAVAEAAELEANVDAALVEAESEIVEADMMVENSE